VLAIRKHISFALEMAMKSGSGFARVILLLLWLTISLPSLVSACDPNLIADGNFDWGDLAVFTEQWLFDNCSAYDWCNGADLNHSGEVDFSDFALLAQNWSQLYIRRVAGFQDDETWVCSGAGVTITADTTPANVKHGDRSLKVHIPSGVTGTAYCTLPLSVTVRSGIGIWVKVDHASSVGALFIEVYENSSKGYKISLRAASTLEDDVWNFVWLPIQPDAWTALNNPTEWGTAANPTYAVSKIRFDIFASGGDINVNFGDLLTQDFPKAGVIIGFDGPYASVYTNAFPAMKARGWRGVVWCVVGNIGISGYMTQAQIQELYDAGWDICSHGYSGVTFTDSTPTATVIEDVCSARDTLHSMGFYRGSQFHSWMGNSGTSALDPNTGEKAGDIAKNLFLAVRGESRFNIPANNNGDYYRFYDTRWSMWIPVNRYCLPYYGLHYGNNTNFSCTAQRYFDLAIAERGVLSTYAHRVLASPSVYDISTTFFNDMTTYLDGKVSAGDIEVITMSDWYNRIVRLSPYP